MYEDEYHPGVRKDLKKLDAQIRKKIKEEHILRILSEPGAGKELTGDLFGIRAYHFRAGRQQYRIAYIVSEETKKVFILMIGKRQNFYTVLKRRF